MRGIENLLAWVATAVALLLLGACGETSTNVCVWEGPVDYTIDEVTATDTHLNVGGEVRWAPCQGDGAVERRFYGIDAASGVCEQLSSRGAGAVVDLAGVEGDLANEMSVPGTTVVLSLVSMDSVLETELTIGQLTSTDTGALIADVECSVRR